MEKNLSQVHLCKTLTLLTAQRLLQRKSTWALALLGLIPITSALLWTLQIIFGFHLNDKPYAIYHHIMSVFFVTFYVPILAIFMGLGVISDEVETKNITFTTVRPLSKTSLVLGRFFGHYLVSLALLLLGLGATYAANLIFQVDALFSQLPYLFNAMFVLAYGLLGYLGIIAAFGTNWKKFAIIGSFIWLVVDTLFSMIPVANLNAISIKYRMFKGFWEPAAQFLPAIEITKGSAGYQGVICALFAVVGCAVIVWRLSYFEINFSADK